MELKDIKAIIDLMKKNDLSVFEMEKDGFRLKLQKGAGEQTVFAVPPMPQTSASPAAAGGTTGPSPASTTSVPPASDASKESSSPMVGTFYRAASPESPPFVDVGREVNEDTVVCIIEAKTASRCSSDRLFSRFVRRRRGRRGHLSASLAPLQIHV